MKKMHSHKSLRLQSWDYRTPWWYFVTICTKNRIRFFGEIENGKICLSEIGKIVEEEWIKTCKVRDNVELDEYVIMPDHFHGIIIINESKEIHNINYDRASGIVARYDATNDATNETTNDINNRKDNKDTNSPGSSLISTPAKGIKHIDKPDIRKFSSEIRKAIEEKNQNKQINLTNYFSDISPKSKSLSSIVRAFKSAVTKKVHEIGYKEFCWQSLFYDRIIRHEIELFKIRKYIKNNPYKWYLENMDSINEQESLIFKNHLTNK